MPIKVLRLLLLELLVAHIVSAHRRCLYIGLNHGRETLWHLYLRRHAIDHHRGLHNLDGQGNAVAFAELVPGVMLDKSLEGVNNVKQFTGH